ncbi:MAG: hypothetical protein JWN37_444 [Candidatus Nomurabacteria bacterium]|nr:hypothetical protein [Candidatus Nomurabacteria bacterium]
MKTNKTILSLVLALILILIAGAYYVNKTVARYEDATYLSSSGDTTSKQTINEYVTANISSLSPVKEQLGGRYYVTNISSKDGYGNVYYEDGHNNYMADFTYKTGTNGKISINSFTIRALP